MADSLHFELVSPERLLKDTEVTQVIVPGTDGDFGVLPNHAPLMSTLRPGLVEIFEAEDGTSERLFVKGGLAQVSKDGLTILAEEALDPATVDAAALAGKMADTREDIEDAADEVEKARLARELVWMTALSEVVAA